MGGILLKVIAIGFFGFVILSYIAQKTFISMRTVIKVLLFLMAFVILAILGSHYGAF